MQLGSSCRPPCRTGCRCSPRAAADGPERDLQPCESAVLPGCCSAARTPRPAHAPRSSCCRHGQHRRRRTAAAGGAVRTEPRRWRRRPARWPSRVAPWLRSAAQASGAAPPHAGRRRRRSCAAPRGSVPLQAAVSRPRASAAWSAPQRWSALSALTRSRPPPARARGAVRLAASGSPRAARWPREGAAAARGLRRPLGLELTRGCAVPGAHAEHLAPRSWRLQLQRKPGCCPCWQ
mmetsp:Transcript_18099/g.49965  ORF Transcript_18099/g.49965 Transcript_18099/m.49965 type:complete len:235 (+) Transcript_18099:324-1028(+)